MAVIFIIIHVIKMLKNKQMMNISVLINNQIRYVPHCITQFALLDFNIKLK